MRALPNQDLSLHLRELDLELSRMPHLKPEVSPRLLRFAAILQDTHSPAALAKEVAREVTGDPIWVPCSVVVSQNDVNSISVQRYPRGWEHGRGDSDIQQTVQELSLKIMGGELLYPLSSSIIELNADRCLALDCLLPENLLYIGAPMTAQEDSSLRGVISLLLPREFSLSDEERHALKGVAVLAGARLEQMAKAAPRSSAEVSAALNQVFLRRLQSSIHHEAIYSNAAKLLAGLSPSTNFVIAERTDFFDYAPKQTRNFDLFGSEGASTSWFFTELGEAFCSSLELSRDSSSRAEFRIFPHEEITQLFHAGSSERLSEYTIMAAAQYRPEELEPVRAVLFFKKGAFSPAETQALAAGFKLLCTRIEETSSSHNRFRDIND